MYLQYISYILKLDKNQKIIIKITNNELRENKNRKNLAFSI